MSTIARAHVAVSSRAVERDPGLQHGMDAFPCEDCTGRPATKSYSDGTVLTGTACELDHVCWKSFEAYAGPPRSKAPAKPRRDVKLRPPKYPGAPFEEGCVACGEPSEFVIGSFTCCEDHTALVLGHLKGKSFPWDVGL